MELDGALIGKEFVHFKGGRYRLVGYAKDSETLEPMCVYEALYGEGGLWVRPAGMFFENEAALKGYAVHPAHVAVANAKVRPFTQTRLCLDYTC